MASETKDTSVHLGFSLVMLAIVTAIILGVYGLFVG
jgi:hypothetical protein